MMAASPSDSTLVSVIVPFGDPRSAVEHLDSWTQQTLAPERFEIIVVANPQRSNLAAIRERLRPHDRLLSTDARNPFPMYRQAAEAARGTILFFTEDHCVAEPECLEAVASFLEDETYAGATVRWAHINHTVVARMEQLVNEIDERAWFAAGHWNDLRIRGFALRRAIYRELGGFQGQYHEFAEAILAAQLHAQQRRIGFVNAAGVRHVNTLTLDHLRHNVQHYTNGECAYCTTHDEGFCDRYFAASHAFAPVRMAAAEDTARHLLALGLVLGEGLRGGGPGRAAALLLIGEWLHLRTSRLRVWLRRRIKAPLSVLTARMRFALWRFNEAAQLRAFKDYWEAVTQATRADFFSRHNPPLRPRLPMTPDAQGEVPLDTLPGLHPIETSKGTSFRWTPPIASILFALPPDDYLVEIDTLGLRGPASRLPLSFLWNDRLLPPSAHNRSDTRLWFRIDRQACDPAGRQRATIVIPAMSLFGSREHRRLGLPVAALRVRPVSPEVRE